MATFESVTYALEHTDVYSGEGQILGNALQLIAGVTGIAGEIPGAGGDRQFRIFVDLKPGAIEAFGGTPGFYRSPNRILFFQRYHKGFPDSYGQAREEGTIGREAGLQPSYNRKLLKADVDVDYRFGRSASRRQTPMSERREISRNSLLAGLDCEIGGKNNEPETTSMVRFVRLFGLLGGTRAVEGATASA